MLGRPVFLRLIWLICSFPIGSLGTLISDPLIRDAQSSDGVRIWLADSLSYVHPHTHALSLPDKDLMQNQNKRKPQDEFLFIDYIHGCFDNWIRHQFDISVKFILHHS